MEGKDGLVGVLEADYAICDRKLKFRFDLALPVHQHMVGELQQHGCYERATQLFLMKVLRAGDHFVDVGAHIGYFTVLASVLVGGEGGVVAVEPAEENLTRLREHVALNGLSNVQVVAAAIGAEDGETTFHLNADNDGAHALWDPAKHPANTETQAAPSSLTVSLMTLGTLLDSHAIEHARLIKIDTEGAEASILGNARSTLEAGRVDFLICEVNHFGLVQMESHEDQLFELAGASGLGVYLPDDGGGPPAPLTNANRPSPNFVYNVILARPETVAATWP